MPAKKKPAATKKSEDKEHTCGDCGWGEFFYDHQNLDLNDKPICLTCPYHKHKKIRSEKACDKWKQKK